jgi:hypothetical protein
MTPRFEGGEDKKDRPKDIRIKDIILPTSSSEQQPKLLHQLFEISGSGFSFWAEVLGGSKISLETT